MTSTTVQAIMQMGWAAYEKSHSLPEHIRCAVASLLACRTALLGGHIQGCPDGHFTRHWYNSCKHRMCPQCAYIQLERWLIKQKNRLISCDHYHVIFTIPHQLNDLYLANVREFNNLLFRSVQETLFCFLQDNKHMGGTPGIIAALHTWNQLLRLHTHIHCLITSGGLTADNQWRKPKRDTLLPYKPVMMVFRGKLLSYIDKAIEKKALDLPPEMSSQQWKNLRNKLGRKIKWNVNFRERYSHGNGVVMYLARYLKGGPIANSRILRCDKNQVTFKCRKDKKKGKGNTTETLPIATFIQRYLLHVPIPLTKSVRYYGLYNPGKKEDLEQARKIFGQLPVQEIDFLTWQDFLESHDSDEKAQRCPVCNKQLICLEEIPAERLPVIGKKNVRPQRKPPPCKNTTIYCGAGAF